MSNEKSLNHMETFFLALADKTRLRIINLMRREEICVGFLVEVLGESQPKISRHLAYLRRVGVVDVRRDGKWMHYKIAEQKNDFTRQVLLDTIEWLNSKDEMREEHKKLIELCRVLNESNPAHLAAMTNICSKTNMRDRRNQELETFLL